MNLIILGVPTIMMWFVDYHNGGCGASIGKDNATPEDAIEAWNRRADNG